MTPVSLPIAMRPRALEVACGLAIGPDEQALAVDLAGAGDPRAALERAVQRALSHPPCLVSFSGGRDSSAVLGLAAAVARREGLPLPVPVTYRFAHAPGSQEDEWQERVVRHLDLGDWDRMQLTSELDSVGPVARETLARTGLLWPFNAHFHVPMLERAAGGTLLTGIGGDELLWGQRWASARAVLTGRRRPRPRDVRSLGLALAPRPVRRVGLSRRPELHWPWLRKEAADAIARERAAWQARAPLGWNRGVEWWWRSRSRTVLAASMELLAADARAKVVHPFLEPSVVAAVARRFGRAGPATRTAALTALFDGLLPHPVLGRRDKAHFDEAFFSEHSRAFAARWTGGGVDSSLVDPRHLAREWRAEAPDARSFLLLQAAWLDEFQRSHTKRRDDG